MSTIVSTERTVAPYCLDCGYDLVGSPTLQCSECGATWIEADFNPRPFEEAIDRASLRLLRSPSLTALLVPVTLLLELTGPVSMQYVLPLAFAGTLLLSGFIDAVSCARATQRRSMLRRRRSLRAWSIPTFLAQLLTFMFLQCVLAVCAVVLSLQIVMGMVGAWMGMR